jgi:hypothetical protein
MLQAGQAAVAALGWRIMTTVGRKAEYVRSEARKGAGDHTCHWPGCGKAVAPSMWGCKRHWFMLPLVLRNKVWAAYRPGQEISKTPSPEYVAVAREVQDWIARNHGGAR